MNLLRYLSSEACWGDNPWKASYDFDAECFCDSQELCTFEELEKQQGLYAVHIVQNSRNACFVSISHITLYFSDPETRLDLHHGRYITKENLLLREFTV